MSEPKSYVAKRGYAGIRRRLLFLLLLLAMTPLLALGLFCYDRLGALYDEKLAIGLESVTNSKHRALDTFLTERVSQIRTLAFTHSYEELSDPERLSSIFSVMQAHSRSFADVGIIGMDGKHVAYVGPFVLRTADYTSAEWFQAVLRRGVYVSDVFMGYRNVPHFIIAVLRHEGSRSFILRATIDMEAIGALLQRLYSAGSSDAFLVNEEGILQTPSRHYGSSMGHFALPLKMEQLRKGGIVVEKLATPSSLQPTTSSSARAAVAMMRLETMPWILVVVDDMTDSLQPLRQLRLSVALLVLLGLVITGFGAVIATRRLVSSLAASDRKQAHIDARMLQSSKMAALGKMAAGVAHEINNPLMLIQENAGWMRDLLEEEDAAKMQNYKELLESTGKIEQHVQRAKGITQRMLGFGRRMNPGRTEIMPNQLLDQAADFLATEARGRHIELVRELGADVPVILSDPAQLQQVFINIIDNAIDAVGKDGTITLRSEAHGKGARLSITDTGPGISPENMKRIFDPFFTTKAVGEGTGLGLAICFSILEKLGGRIEVESTPGQGTTFRIDLPPEPPETAATAEPEDEEA